MKMVFILWILGIAIMGCKENKAPEKSIDSMANRSSSQKTDSISNQTRFLQRNDISVLIPDSIIPRYRFTDESAQDSSLLTFIEKLLSALEQDKPVSLLSLFPDFQKYCITPEKAHIAFELEKDSTGNIAKPNEALLAHFKSLLEKKKIT